MNLGFSTTRAMAFGWLAITAPMAWCAEGEPSASPTPAASAAKAAPANGRPLAAGEDLGDPAGDRDLLTRVARDMRASERLLRQKQTTAATKQVQRQIADQLAKLLAQGQQRENRAQQRPAPPSDQSAENASASGQPRESIPADGAQPKTPDREHPASPADLVTEVWGQLPDEVQRQIQSPTHEEFLPEYEQLIVEYYKRLAADKRP